MQESQTEFWLKAWEQVFDGWLVWNLHELVVAVSRIYYSRVLFKVMEPFQLDRRLSVKGSIWDIFSLSCLTVATTSFVVVGTTSVRQWKQNMAAVTEDIPALL